MKYTVEESLLDFKAWSGGKDTLDTLLEHDVVDQAEQYIEEVTRGSEELPTKTEINNILWFNCDDIYKYCGIYNKVYNEDNDDEEYLTEHWMFKK